MQLLNWLSRLNAHLRLLLATGITVVVALLLPGGLLPQTRAVILWIVFASTVSGLTWLTILLTLPRDTPTSIPGQDLGWVLIFVFIILAALVSLFANIVLLRPTGALSNSALNSHILLSLLSVVCSWVLVHTVYAIHYAYVYYGKAKEKEGGLKFPGTKEPDYDDFAYFSFGIGMTSQVSDVQVTNTQMRWLVLLHSLLSFAFNSIIISLCVSTLSSIVPW